MDKKQLRRKILKKRDALLPAERRRKSLDIIKAIIRTDQYVKASHIMLFSSFGSEPDLSPLLKEILKDGKHAYLPVVVKGDKKILPVEVTGLDGLTAGPYGILEPDTQKYKDVTPSLLELIITPGVAFDPARHRIGYGAGYYDRFFASLPHKVCKIGVAFDEQLVQSVPKEQHDIALDLIITDKRLL